MPQTLTSDFSYLPTLPLIPFFTPKIPKPSPQPLTSHPPTSKAQLIYIAGLFIDHYLPLIMFIFFIKKDFLNSLVPSRFT